MRDEIGDFDEIDSMHNLLKSIERKLDSEIDGSKNFKKVVETSFNHQELIAQFKHGDNVKINFVKAGTVAGKISAITFTESKVFYDVTIEDDEGNLAILTKVDSYFVKNNDSTKEDLIINEDTMKDFIPTFESQDKQILEDKKEKYGIGYRNSKLRNI